MTWRGWPFTTTVSPCPPVSVSASVAAGSRLSRRWSSVTICSAVPSFTVPASGASRPVSRFSSVVLPAPFGPTRATRSPRRILRGQAADDHPLAEAFAEVARLDDDAGRRSRPRPPPASRCRAGLAPRGAAARRACRLPSAADVALAPGGDAVAQPVFLGGDLAGELVVVAFLLLQHLVAPGFELGEAALHAAGGAAVEPHHGAAEPLQQAAVMADQHQGRAQAGQFRFQPGDGGQVEMVGGLVEQQDVGRRGQHAGQRGAPRLAAGEAGGVLRAGEAERLQQGAGAVRVVARAQPGCDIGLGAVEAGEVGLLRQVAHGGAGLQEAGARRRRPAGRRRCAAGWICPSRCGRPGTAARRGRPTVRRRASSGAAPRVREMSWSSRRGGAMGPRRCRSTRGVATGEGADRALPRAACLPAWLAIRRAWRATPMLRRAHDVHRESTAC